MSRRPKTKKPLNRSTSPSSPAGKAAPPGTRAGAGRSPEASSPLSAQSTDQALLLTLPQVCHLLNLSRSTLDRMAKDNLIPGRLKIGGQIRYHRPTLDTWLLSHLQS